MTLPSSILAIGIDPATHSGVALVRLVTRTGEAELIGLWAIYGDGWRAWCARAMEAALDAARKTDGRPVVGWHERPAPARPGDQAWNPCPMAERAGAILMAFQVAGVQGVWAPVNASRWTALARVPAGKSGDGTHRIEEAAARIEFAGAELEALDHCRVDAAEAALIALACARAEAERLSAGQQLPLASSSSNSNSTSTMRPLTGRRASPAAVPSGAALFSGENNMTEKEIPAPADDPRWYAAGWMERGYRVISVVYRGVEVIRRAHTGGVSCALAVQIAAAKLAAREAGPGAEVCLHDSVAWKMLIGEGCPQNPAVLAALQVSVPEVKYSLIAAASNPARAFAFEAGAALLRGRR